MRQPGDSADLVRSASEDEDAARCLTILRDGEPIQQAAARRVLAQIFERRGMLAEATELLETNVQIGAAEADTHVRLASLYRRQGRPDLAEQALAHAVAIDHGEQAVPAEPTPQEPVPARPNPIGPSPSASRVRFLTALVLGIVAGLGIVAVILVASRGWYCADCPDLEPNGSNPGSSPAQDERGTRSDPASTPEQARPLGDARGSDSVRPPLSAFPSPTTAAILPTPSPIALLAAPLPASPSPSPEPALAPTPSPTRDPSAPEGANCPSDRPIKGNQGSRSTTEWIYHLPGGRSYNVTVPEECFATEADAQRAGYRRALR